MRKSPEFFDLNDPTQGLRRELAPGLCARIFVGDRSMLSFVTFEPHGKGEIHRHPEEQWGVLLEGDGIRIQGDLEVAVKVGSFWRTPGGVPHGFRAGAEGALVLDVFSPPRKAYREAGGGFE